jgi:pimeloyl-ACP methyl ester carboxylesterase
MRKLTSVVAVGAAVAGCLIAGSNTVAAVAGQSPERQRPVGWHGCQTGPDDDPGRQLDLAGVQCAEVTVPLDYAEPDGRSISVAISRLKATDTAQRRGVLLVNPGGPGAPALDFPVTVGAVLGDVAGRYDLIGFDHRFVGRSTPVDCGPMNLATALGSAGENRAGFTESARAAAGYAAACHDRHASVLPYAGTRDLARDMDMIRAALGAPRISYYGVSYGADLGAVYSQLFPHRVDRMVIDSATAVTSEYRAAVASIRPAERAVDEWAGWVARRPGEYGLGTTRAEVRAALIGLLDRLARGPVRVGDLLLDDRNLPLILRMGLADEDDNAMLAGIVRDAIALAAGRPVEPTPALAGMLGTLYAQDPMFTNAIAAIFAVRCSDGGWPADPDRYWADIRASRSAYPIFGPLYHNINACAFWSDTSPEPPTAIGNAVPMLMVQALRDKNTPIAGARELHRKLTGSRLLTVDVRTHGVYIRQADGHAPIPCGVRAVNDYLGGGALPPRDSTCG